MYTKIPRKLFFGFLYIAGFIIFFPLITNIFSDEESMKTLGLCTTGDIGCSILHGAIIALFIIIIGLLISGILLVITYIIFRIRWRNYINIFKRDNYIGADIRNKDSRPLIFYCVLKSIYQNNAMNLELFSKVTDYTPRISWSGGAQEEIGKLIDGNGYKGILNFVSIDSQGLVFEMAKGGKKEGIHKGSFILINELFAMNGSEIVLKKTFKIQFQCSVESGKQTFTLIDQHKEG